MSSTDDEQAWREVTARLFHRTEDDTREPAPGNVVPSEGSNPTVPQSKDEQNLVFLRRALGWDDNAATATYGTGNN